MTKVQTEINTSTTRNQNSALPEGWRWVRLGDVCEINPRRPKNFSRAYDAPTTFVPMVAVDEKTGTIARPEAVPYSKVAKGYTYFEENDVLFAKITPCMQNGKHVIARGLIDGIGFGTTEFHVLRPDSDVLPAWIRFFIRQQYFLHEATAYFTGAVGQQRIPESFLSNYIIPLPPIEEQKRIVAKVQGLMQEVERARTACEKQLEAAKALPSAYLREVFESEEAKKWERKRLGEIAKKYQYGLIVTSSDEAVGYPLLRISDITDDGNLKKQGLRFVKCNTDTYEKYKLEQGDILIARSGSVGRSFLYEGEPENAIFASYLIRFNPIKENVDPKFLFYFTHSGVYLEFINWKKHTLSQPNINAQELKSLEIPLPPLSIQQRIATELKDKMTYAEKLCISIEKQLEAINALPQAILRKAFRGEI
jgi:type I restriction enzyme S subunit